MADGAGGGPAGERDTGLDILNSLRLVLGTRLDVDEELPDLDPSDPQAPVYAVYEYLGWLLSQVVDALGSDLPPPSADARRL